MIHKPEEFEELYQQGGWDGKGSGPGSTEAFTRGFREVFEKLLVDKQIKSVFDLGCGDWQWQQHLKWRCIDYRGWDTSRSAIKLAEKRLVPHILSCDLLDTDAFIQPIWPEADLLLVKDVVHHITPYRVRMLIDRAKHYSYVLWVMDVNDMLLPINFPSEHESLERLARIYNFDTSIENYAYGPKAAFLQTNP